MKKYVFDEYSDKMGYGDTRFFDSQKEAVEYAADAWERLTASDKALYLTASQFRVFAIECTPEEFEQIKDGDLFEDDFWIADIWDALN